MATRWQAALQFEQGGLEAFCILYVENHFGYSPEIGPGAEAAAERIRDSFKTTLRTCMTTECALVSINMKSTFGTPDDFNLTILAADGRGTAVGGAASINNAMLVRKVFDRTRRPGYMYLPGVPESQLTAGSTLLPAWVSKVATDANTFLDELAGNGIAASGPDLQLTGPGEEESNFVISMGCSAQVGIQKRRRRG